MSLQKTLIRAALNGIVYWVDNTPPEKGGQGDCYTYCMPPEVPTLIGKAIKDPFDPKTLHIQLLPDYKDIMARKLAETATAVAGAGAGATAGATVLT
jgi:hypothetical protein